MGTCDFVGTIHKTLKKKHEIGQRGNTLCFDSTKCKPYRSSILPPFHFYLFILANDEKLIIFIQCYTYH